MLELCPELTLLGETLEEASSLLAEHERVMEKIQVYFVRIDNNKCMDRVDLDC